MRLKHIKLAGFKSFVDPTKVPFEQQMTAIVGPNGCGKSNIIDAVRWVLGESSAKNLRGDAMTDVIFNGASTRKPIGQASVELLFDNMAERIQGSMADRNQISIRRVVNRDSQNTYFLNGTKCRRKDITDIFLGTGLGPRSYAIIEQGTISRLIESKPQELRVFIEEAAGISKYKERRRETENRIRHTRENLERLTDIRIELNHQIEKLHQQAEAAKRFKTLKTQERKIKAELAVLRWQKFSEQYEKKQTQFQGFEEKIAQNALTQKSEDIALFSGKQNVQLQNDSIQVLQQDKIQLTNDVARIEQHIKHVKQQQQKLQDDKAINHQQMNNAQQSLLSEQDQYQSLTLKLDKQQPEFVQLEQDLTELQQQTLIQNATLLERQQAWNQSHLQREELAKVALEHAQHKAEYQAVIKQKQQRLQVVTEQLTKLDETIKTQISQTNIDNKLNELVKHQQQLAELEDQQQTWSTQLSRHAQNINQLKQQQSECLGTRQATTKNLEYIQQKLTSKTHWQQSQQAWLEKQSVEYSVELQQKLTITEGWELAVEVVLSYRLQAACINELPFELLGSADVPESLLLLKDNPLSHLPDTEYLADKISGANEVIGELNKIKTAENYQQALLILPTLAQDESVISPDGIWLSAEFIRKGVISEKNDYFTHQQEFTEQQKLIDDLHVQLNSIEKQLVEQQSQQQALTTKVVEKAALISEKQQQISECKQQQLLDEKSQAVLLLQKDDLSTELNQLTANIADNKKLLSNLAIQEQQQQKLDVSSNEAAVDEGVTELAKQIQDLQQQLQRFQTSQVRLTEQKHQIELSIEKNKHQLQHSQQSIIRFQANIQQLSTQQTANAQLLDESIQPLIDDEQQWQTWLKQMSAIDSQLQHQQTSMADEQQRINSIEQKQRQVVESTSRLKEQLNQLHLEGESCRLKAEASLEHLHELGQNVKQVKEQMPDNARESQWQAQLIRLAKDIQVLGAINLAAIDEFETQLTRKNYLDQQDEDLNLAITTLESAIEKIDKESRYKFQTTFDKVNKDLQSLFPKVFGGGQAYLTLTGDDLLDTGVTIMARPPGKKNSTIHLLSGGEKALTALSLVFAIFRLNPAPFCMLDEVDAPLDDANVSRFCNLVREMSQTVQFIYISHNKIAMEMATHLTGVTMFEAGVSRVVAVDIDEAISMAEVS